MLFFVCGVTTACKDKYENLEFNIEYNLTGEDSGWIDANNGISLNYGGRYDDFKLNNGTGTIYVKVSLENVNKKDVDEIIVTGNASSTVRAKSGEVFALPVDSVVSQTNLRFYEANSGKHKNIRLSLFSSLKEIVADNEIRPVAVVGQTINLSELDNLTFVSNTEGKETNQTAVSYGIESIGYYDEAKEYHETYNKGIILRDEYASIDNYNLHISDSFEIRDTAYVIKVKATSKYHNGSEVGKEDDIISDVFDLYIMEKSTKPDNTQSQPIIEYENPNITSNKITLYKNDDKYGTNSEVVNINLDEITDIYSAGVYTNTGLSKYVIQVYVDGDWYDVESEPTLASTLRITEEEPDGSKIHRYRILAQGYDDVINNLTFRAVVEGLDYRQVNFTYEASTEVEKRLLPTAIMVNGNLMLDDSIGSGTIYSTKAQNYLGMEMTLEAAPTDHISRILSISKAENLIITGDANYLGNGYYSVVNGGKIYIKFKEGVTERQEIKLEVLSSPEGVAPEYITVIYNLNTVVTADEIEILPEIGAVQNVNNGKVYISATTQSYIFVKTIYTGELDRSSIEVVSNNEDVKFGNGKTSIKLSESSAGVVSYGEVEEDGKVYQCFGVPVKPAGKIVKGVNISVIAGGGLIGVDENVTAESVYLANKDSFAVFAEETEGVTYFTGAGESTNVNYLYAVVAERLLDFEVKGKLKGGFSPTTDAVANIELERLLSDEGTGTSYNEGNFYAWATSLTQTSKNSFSIIGKSIGRTQVVNLRIQYYDVNLHSGVQLFETEIILQFAVYTPIKNIEARVDKQNIAYINDHYSDAAKATISFETSTGSSSSVVFSNPDNHALEKVIDNVSQLKIYNTANEYASKFNITLNDTTKLTNGSLLQVDDGLGNVTNILKGIITFELKENLITTGYNSIALTFKALRFGTESKVELTIVLNFVNNDPVKGIVISGDEIVYNDIHSNYIYMSFMRVGNGGNDKASFKAEPYFENEDSDLRFGKLGYELFRIEQDENGEIVESNDKLLLTDAQNFLNIVINEKTNTVDITAHKSFGGGLFLLNIVALDSFTSEYEIEGTTAKTNYLVANSVYVHISDGSARNPYTISTVEDFAAIENDVNAHYQLINNLNLGEISTTDRNVEFKGVFEAKEKYISGGVNVECPRYTISYTVNSLFGSEHRYMGLFGIIADDASVGGFDIIVNINTSSVEFDTASKQLNIGAIAGVNNGTIEDINATISFNTSLTNKVKSISVINLGGLVGINNGTINLAESTIKVADKLYTTSSVKHNIGMIAGTNNGVIVGDYNDKDSLTAIKFTVLADVVVEYATKNPTEQILLAGVAAENNGEIRNVLVGGGLTTKMDETPAIEADRRNCLLGGVVAYNNGADNGLLEEGTINTVSTLSLDLRAYQNTQVAGIVAKSENGKIDLVRVLSAATKHNNKTFYGIISGYNNVAGIVVDSLNDIISRATVESYLQVVNGRRFNTLVGYENATIAGLVANVSGSTTIDSSFVNANIRNYQGNVYLTSNAAADKELDTFFLGKVELFNTAENDYVDVDDSTTGINAKTSSRNYAVIYDDEKMYTVNETSIAEIPFSNFISDTIVNFLAENTEITSQELLDAASYLYYKEQGGSDYYKVEAGHVYNANNTYFTFDAESWQRNWKSLYIKNGLTDYSINNSATFDANKIYCTLSKNVGWLTTWENNFTDLLAQDNWEIDESSNSILVNGFAFHFPYIEIGGKPLMIERPTKITAAINANYRISTNSIYVSDYTNDYIEGDLAISSTIIVNYKNSATANNTHNLLNTATEPGLIDLTIIPADAQGGIGFEIVQGSAYAYIDGYKITFTGVTGGENRIVVRCYSKFNAELQEFVEIHTDFGTTDLILESNNVYETEEPTNAQDYAVYAIRTYVGAENVLIYAKTVNEDIYGKYSSIIDADVDEFLKLDITSNSASSVVDFTASGNSFNELVLSVKEDADFADNLKIEVFTIKLKLNWGRYLGKNVDEWIELEETSLRVVVTKAATSVEIDGSDYVVSTSSNVTFNVNLYTGYVNAGDKFGVVDTSDKYLANRIILSSNNKDGIGITIEAVNGMTEINKLMAKTGATHFIELFNFTISYSPIENASGLVGYTYHITISLKDEHDYRFIESNIDFKVLVYALSKNEIQDSINLTYVPTEVSTIRVENYTAVSSETQNNLTTLITSNATQTSIISPGGMGGVMMIYMEPSYSNVVSAELTSSYITVAEYNHPIRMRYEQLVFNTVTKKYQTIYPRNELTEAEDGIKLVKASSVDGSNNYSYNGIIYVHTIIDKFVGRAETIKSTLNVTTTSGETKTVTKTLITKYLPGASISYNGKLVATGEDGNGNAQNKYLVQKNSYNNELEIKIYGYQFNTNPNITFTWEDESDSSDIHNYISYRLLNNNAIENADGSYSIKLMLNVYSGFTKAIKASVKMSLMADGDLITSEERSLILYPVDYIIDADGVSLANVSNNEVNVHINKQAALGFNFKTQNNLSDLNSTIYADMVKQIAGEGTDFDESKLIKLFRCEDGSDLSDHSSKFEFKTIETSDSHIITIAGKSKFSGNILFTVNFGYYFDETDGVYKLKFGLPEENTLSYTASFTFKLNIYSTETRENAIPIYAVTDMFDENGNSLLAEGGNYVLMNDIEIESLKPIDVKIGSFDGNNKRIKIKSFVVDAKQQNYGLFASIGTYTPVTEEGDTVSDADPLPTLLYNIVLDYSECADIYFTNNQITNVVFGGLVGVNNGGVIYNCDVMNFGNNSRTIKLVMDNNSNAQITFGGLVGKNEGNNSIITNSRVGRNSFTKLNVEENMQYTTQLTNLKNLTFVIGTEENKSFKSNVGGFVGVNSGRISSSYIANTNIINYSTVAGQNKTAGFAAENITGGKIAYSYVKGDERTISSGTPRADGAAIESKTNGNVAGFVYLNSGNVDNCYANIKLKSDSAYVAGFVYNNATSGVVSQSYAACILNGMYTANDASEQPFVGVSEEDELLSFGKLINTYYYLADTLKLKEEDGKDQAQGLNSENISNSENLINFVFVLSGSKTEREQGIWSYYTNDDRRVILPELSNANHVAHSYRYISGKTEDGKNLYEYAIIDSYNGYDLGTKNNPNIISSVDDFNRILRGSDEITSQVGYYRIVNNLNFESDRLAIATRRNYTLGSTTALTSLEGNGLDIKGVLLDVGDSVEQSIGLFSNVENAYIKNINIDFSSGSFSSANVQYSGGLAGTINNSIIVNVSLNGKSTTLNGKNFVGGLAGKITGKSLIYGITSNVSVKANSESEYMYVSENKYSTTSGMSYETYLTKLSYAGGLAGVIDITERASENFNMSYVTINGYEMQGKDSSGNNISAAYAGGIAGYAGEHITATRLKYNVGVTNRIKGQYAVGGLFAISASSIEASQVTAVEDEQFKYDTTLGKYVINKDTLDTTNAGNLTLLEGYGYVGGLIGIGINAKVDSCYSKAGIYSGEVVGGLIGSSIASKVSFSYAVPYINIKTDAGVSHYENVGAMFGEVYSENSSHKYVALLKALDRYTQEHATAPQNHLRTDVSYTFSSLITDETEYANLGKTFDIFAAVADANVLTSLGMDSNFTNVYVGRNGTLANAHNSLGLKAIELADLYNVAEDNVEEQKAIFNEVFSLWVRSKYWSLNSNKYFPLLLNDVVSNFYEISEDFDWTYMVNHPDGNYIIKRDLDIATWVGEHGTNYVFDCEFTGILIGQYADKTNTGAPQVTGISLKPTEGGSTGLFRATKGATISNLQFVWEDNGNGAIDLTANTNTIQNIGGVSCSDTADGDEVSEFNGVTVAVNGGSGYLVNTSKEIKNVGGIVAAGLGTQIKSCSFTTVKVNANRGGSSENPKIAVGLTESSHFGVVAGNLEKSDYGAGTSATILNSTISETTIKVIAGKNSNVGGLVGSASNTTISSNTITKLTSDVTATGTSNISSIVGNAARTYIGGNIVTSSLNLTSEGTDGVLNIGSLAGLYDSTYTIQNNYIKTSMDLTQVAGNISALRISNGVAEAIGDEIKFIQNIFDGSIKAEPASTDGKYGTVWAGGAVALANLDKVNIAETMSLTDMTVGSTGTNQGTNQLYAGGFVGGGNIADNKAPDLVVANSSSSGKLVPVTSAESDYTNVKVFVGGFAGLINRIDSNSAYSTSSIITDGIGYNTVPYVHINALVGKTLDNDIVGRLLTENKVDNTYYSSDIALVTEDIGTNLTAMTLVGSSVLGNSFNSDSWTKTSNHVPYITSLKTYLVNKGYVEGDAYKHEGKSYNPIIVNSENYTEFKLDNHYILNSNLANISFNTEAKGVIIANEVVYHGTFFTSISKHSAVSNLHINLKDGGLVTLNNNYGYIAGENNGVMFNCSVSGTAYEHTLSSAGLLVGKNYGLMNYCYSNAEIKLTNASLGGLTYTNAGVISNSYFTGYIGNKKAKAADTPICAGIYIDVDTSNRFDYVYNCYMAGTIESISNTGSFAGSVLDADHGKNNFVDTLADVNKTIKIDEVLTPVSTCNLMQHINFVGNNWTNVLIEHFDSENKGVIFDTNSDAFGYNYGYPMAIFNKLDENLNYVDEFKNYHLYTGKGKSSDGIRVDTVLLKDGSTTLDYIKIPHLGVLSAVQGLLEQKDPNSEEIVATNRNYCLIYDIDGTISKDEGRFIDWTSYAVGRNLTGTEKSINGFAYSQHGFNGTFISNKGYTLVEAPTEFDPDDKSKLCLVTNISGFGLFDNVNAKISHLLLGNFINLTNSGALGGTVTGATQVKHVGFEGVRDGSFIPATISAADVENNHVGGLFGIVASDLTITGIETLYLNTHTSVTMQTTSTEYNKYLGLIAGKVATIGETTGTIILDNSAKLKGETHKLHVNFDVTGTEGYIYAGGIAGLVDGGTVISTNKDSIVVSASNANVSNIGGAVGRMSSGAIENITTEFDTVQQAYTFGAVVAMATGGKIDDVTIDVNSYVEANSIGLVVGSTSGDVTINNIDFETIEINGLYTKHFGILTALMNSGTLKLTGSGIFGINIIVHSTDETLLQNDDNAEKFAKQGYGVLAGKMTGGNFEIETAISGVDLTASVENNNKISYNLGGLVGYYSAGGFKMNEFAMQSITLRGGNNVGGAFGYCASIPTIEGSWNFLTQGTEWATITTGAHPGLGDTYNNWGGLFGKLTAEINVKDVYITNANSIIIDTNLIPSVQKDVVGRGGIIGIGGIAGYADGVNLTNVKNVADITYEGDVKKFNIKGDIIEGKEKLQIFTEAATIDNVIKTFNVGGIVGEYKNGTIKNALNMPASALNSMPEIQGYSNVGGLVGMATKATITADLNWQQTNGVTSANFVAGKYYTKTTNGTEDIYTLAESYENDKTYHYLNKDALNWTKIENLSEDNFKKGTYYLSENVNDVAETWEAGKIYYSKEEIPLGDAYFWTKTGVNANVYGMFNVGGAVGHSTDLKLENIDVKAVEVFGNSSVGGLIGRTSDQSGSTISNNVVKVADLAATTVQASYVEEEHTTTNFIMPTSVGGMVGYLSSATSNTIKLNIVDVKITSAKEGLSTFTEKIKVGTNGAKTISSPVISVVENAMVDSDGYISSLYIQNAGKFSFNFSSNFNTMATGIGGFVGTMNYAGPLGNYNELTVDINAKTGINVGAFYGYYQLTKGNTLSVPTLKTSGETCVRGAYNIGGIAGYLNFAGGTIEYAGGNLSVQKDASFTGMYVGGMFGKVVTSEDIKVLKTSSTITINTSNTYYAGGLIGQLEGNLNPGEGETNKLNVSATNIVVEDGCDDRVNFGGLVGLLKVTDNESSKTKIVRGYHEYAFTINTIQNSNYADGASSFKKRESDDGGIDLYAQAYYINLDSFKISATSNTEIYIGSKGHGDVNHPLNENKYGWHKDYTGFRIIQRLIPQGQNNGAAWDSISVIYDAANINHVGTIANLGLKESIDTLPKPSTRTEPYTEDYICFTVYEEEEGFAKLYSAMGIAEVMRDNDVQYVPTVDYDANKYEKVSEQLYVKVGEGDYTIYSPVPNVPGLTGDTYYCVIPNDSGGYMTPKDIGKPEGFEEAIWNNILLGESKPTTYYIDANNSANGLQGLTYFTWGTAEDTWAKYTTIGENGKNVVETNYQILVKSDITGVDDFTQQSDKYIVYFVPNYLDANATYYNDESKPGAYFKFSVVFANNSSDILLNGNINSTNPTDAQLSKSGSLFEVAGYLSDDLNEARRNTKIDWDTVAGTVGEILFSVGLAVLTGGLSALGSALFKEFFEEILQGGAKKLGKWLLKGLVVSTLATMTLQLFVQHYIVDSYQKQSISNRDFVMQLDQNYGFLSSAYTYKVNFDKDNMAMADSDKYYIDENGNGYLFHSFERPTDFYNSEYIGMVIDISKLNVPDWDSISDKVEYTTDKGLIPDTATDIVWQNLTSEQVQDTKTIIVNEQIFKICQIKNEEDGTFTYYAYEPYYAFHNNSYWINANAGEVKGVRTTLFTPAKVKIGVDATTKEPVYTPKPTTEPYYITSGENIYEFGYYTGSGYQFNKPEGYSGPEIKSYNRLQLDGTEYSINGEDVTGIATQEQELYFMPDNRSETKLKNAKFIEGYNYMKNAYYTVNGYQGMGSREDDANAVYIKDISGLTKNVDYVTRSFDVWETYTGDLYIEKDKFNTSEYRHIEGVSYNQEIDDYGNPTGYTLADGDTGTHYKVTEQIGSKDFNFRISIEEGDGSKLTGGVLDKSPIEGDYIKVKVYPYSFTNPYLDKRIGNYYKDNKCYFYSTDPTNVIPHKATYYLWDGGYVVGDGIKDDPNTTDVIEGNGGKEGMVYEAYTGSNLTVLLLTIDNSQAKQQVHVTYSEDNDLTTNANTPIDKAELIKNWDKYKDCYLYGEPITNTYLVVDGELYQSNTLYFVNKGGTNHPEDNKGLLHTWDREIGTNEDDENYSINKYLTNKNVNLYTRYKYTLSGGATTDLSGAIWNIMKVKESGEEYDTQEKYTWISSPDDPTQLVKYSDVTLTERVKVTLFGSIQLSKHDGKNLTEISGSLTIE